MSVKGVPNYLSKNLLQEHEITTLQRNVYGETTVKISDFDLSMIADADY
jgi:hypothetical protein